MGEPPGIEESCLHCVDKKTAKQAKKSAEESAGKRVGGQASANF